LNTGLWLGYLGWCCQLFCISSWQDRKFWC